jgi:sulfide:quinone oxidoreductase
VGFEKYYLRKMRQGKVEPFFERYAMRLLGATKLKDSIRPH